VSNRKWLPLNALRAFEAVGKLRSFTAGARATGVTQSAVSRHVAGMEELLGTKLLIRQAYGVTLSKAGTILLPAVDKSFDELERALSNIQKSAPATTRTLKIHFPPSFLQQLAMPILSEFRAQFPDISLDIVTTNAPGLTMTDCQVAVIYDRPQVTDAIRDLLWQVRATLVCSPHTAEDTKSSSLVEFLLQHELLHVRVQGEPHGYMWKDFVRRHGLSLGSTRYLTFDTLVLAVQYAMEGSGIALADVEMFTREIADGRLVAPYAEEYENGYGYYLTMAAEDLEDPAIAAFRNWIIARLARRRTIKT
jgi:LysR family glycine cleavage system transcriptional activator